MSDIYEVFKIKHARRARNFRVFSFGLEDILLFSMCFVDFVTETLLTKVFREGFMSF